MLHTPSLFLLSGAGHRNHIMIEIIEFKGIVSRDGVSTEAFVV
jgi:hypothetical protein